MISNNFRFWDKSIILQDVSLKYDISHWNKTKPFVFQGDIAVLQKIIGITSIVWTITQPENKQHFRSYVTIFRVIFRVVKSCR